MKVMNFFISLFISLLILSCGGSSDSNGLASGIPRAVIKNGNTTIAHIVAWTKMEGVVGVYIPSVDKYAVIELETGLYSSAGISSNAIFYYSADGCSGSPAVVAHGFVGEVGKAIVFNSFDSQYYRVTAKRTSYAYGSSLQMTGGYICGNLDGTVQESLVIQPFDIVNSTQPYDFASIAPLSITYE